MKKMAFLLSHPIQYHSPLFDEMSLHPEIDLSVFYCSNYGADGSEERVHPELGKIDTWDIPLLEGYNYVFLKNYSWKPSIFKGFFGLVNAGIIQHLVKGAFDVVIVNGWNYFSYVFTIVLSKFFGVKVYVRGDNSIQGEEPHSMFKKFFKKLLLQHILFRFIDRFLYVGESNKLFFKYYGVKDNKLVFAPHAVDNKRFTEEYDDLKDSRKDIRKQLGINEDDFVILFVGKLIEKKRPMDLLRAFVKIKLEKKHLVFVGFGPLQEELLSYISKYDIKGVQITGFKNQKELCKYYISGDVFVLPSSYGETWGLVVNEAMNFHLPVILSDLTGCSKNLLNDEVNGFVFKTGDVNALYRKLNYLLNNTDKSKEMGDASARIIKEYSYDKIIAAIFDSKCKT